ncbi:HU family DNA-binding protein [Bacteroides helcogenes]|uniref:DNA-binding protein n=1 Tax=Bacteroides helcogenes (strain ATCC 35417 / DSM 20613 / JCM 6297 / CCUG 15421 / P 36-108) TaxID=693979 RepID=E6SVT3_BACT6|nr:HU family DNA-binding protein [Bacteroides helcogenes]ADV44522.1 DNA-binding protein [Bacteroides helcogenes P 36-108]MDY5239000.1 HU family DNA-binding protein [Bacteroides helcogenes]
MAEYDMQELTLPNEEGKRIFYPKMQLYGQKDLEDIARTVAYATSFTRGDIKGLLQAVTEEIACSLGGGYSVKIEGLGIFTPALGLRQGKERESGEEGDPKRNAASICLKDVNFKADKDFVRNAGQRCHLQRAQYKKCRRSSQLFAPQERLDMAKDYLCKNLLISVAEYSRLTGLLKTAAAKELKEWASQPETGIGYKGRGTHKVYVLREHVS